MSTRLVWSSATGAPMPTPAQLTSTSRRPKRSRCAATTRCTSASSAMLPATASTSRPADRSVPAAVSSLSGRRAATVRPWPSSPRTWAMARPIPLEAPVTMAARWGIGRIQPWAPSLGGVRWTWLAGIVVAGLAAFLVLGAHEKREPRAAPTPTPTAPAPDVGPIAARVERLRDLRFRQRPRPARVTGAQARREGLADFDRSYPPARRRADEEVLKLLGLLRPDADLRSLSASVFGEGVAGYYDPRTKRLRIVTGASTANRVLAEVTLAHELTHALEDQRFGLDLQAGGSDDDAIARLALVEGSATVVMTQYLLRRFGTGEALAGLLGGGPDTGPKLPAFVRDQLLFPYTGGMAFVQALLSRAGGKWTLVDLADRARAPQSTEQILHPDAWIRVEAPKRVRLASRLGAGWRRTAAGTWGEWQTRELLGGDAVAAAGWGGDRYELWQREAAGCAAPCRRADVLVMRWRWDTRRDAREFLAALRRSDAGRRGRVTARGDTVTLALAPSRALAQRAAAA